MANGVVRSWELKRMTLNRVFQVDSMTERIAIAPRPIIPSGSVPWLMTPSTKPFFFGARNTYPLLTPDCAAASACLTLCA